MNEPNKKENALDLSNSKNAKKTCMFAITCSFSMLLINILTFLLGWLSSSSRTLYTFGIIYPFIFLVSLGTVIFTLVTFKKRSILDLIIVFVIFAATLAITIQCVIYFYRATTWHFYYSLDYEFPGILYFNRHELVSSNPDIYQISWTKTLFDPTLIVSFACFVTSLIFYFKEKKKNGNVGS